MSILPHFLVIFSEGDNFCDFLFVSLGNETFLKMVNSRRKEIAHREANAFTIRADLIQREVRITVTCPEVVSIHLLSS